MAKQPGSPPWSWKRRRLLRANVRSRYEHVSQRGWHLPPFIYIPAVAEYHITKAQRAHQSTLLSELARLAALNVPWACAILSYLALLARDDGSRDVERAVSLCQKPAEAGDAYAQYMLAWAFRFKGDWKSATENLVKSASALFPPAVLDYASFYSPTQDTNEVKEWEKLRLASSGRVGHRFTFARRLQFYRSGRFGVLNLILGYLLMPCALARIAVAAKFSPHSAAVCLFQRNLTTKVLQLFK